jgi:hypothetical protein
MEYALVKIWLDFPYYRANRSSSAPLIIKQGKMGDVELPMTMQVAMIGTDGIVLASDTQCTVSPSGMHDIAEGGTHTRGESKIRINENKRLAVSCASDMVNSAQIADAIISDFPILKDALPQTREARMWEIGNTLAAEHHIQCIIVFADPIPDMYFLEFARNQGIRSCRQMINKVAAGNTVNAAVYWQEAYYSQRPISHLVRLAAHQVVAASKLGFPGIGGLEIMVCDASGIDIWDEERNRKLELETEVRHERIGELVMESI